MDRMYFKASEVDDISVIDHTNSTLKVLKARKLILPAGQKLTVSAEGIELIAVVVSGTAHIALNKNAYRVKQFDVVYLTLGDSVEITAGEAGCALLEGSAAAENSYESVVVERDKCKVLTSGAGCFKRLVWQMVAPGTVQADRLILGYCEGEDGGWTGWAPHEHGENLEELYYYYGQPENGGALQFYYEKDIAEIQTRLVKNGDICALGAGYHPIVALPGSCLKNIFFMAAIRPVKDRRFSLAKTDPRFL